MPWLTGKWTGRAISKFRRKAAGPQRSPQRAVFRRRNYRYPAILVRVVQLVRAALALVERGEVPLGQVYATDAAISRKVRVVGIFPPGSHPAIVYPVAIIAGHRNPAVGRFMDFLGSAESRGVFERYGFQVR